MQLGASSVVWVAQVAVLGIWLAPIGARNGPTLAMDLPILLAAGFLEGPTFAGFVALLGSVDPRELRRQVSWSLAAFNRGQTALSVMAGAWVFELLGGEVGRWPIAGSAAVAAVFADGLLNYLLVVSSFCLRRGAHPAAILARMRFGPAPLFALAYVCLGFLGLVAAEVIARLGWWGLFSFVAVLFLARQAFAYRRELDVSLRSLSSRRKLVKSVLNRIADERRDERRRIAAALHDDVLSELHNVTIHAHVLKEDLRSGRLLQLDEDLPSLLHACARASEALRNAISDLRESRIGRAGLVDTLRLLIERVREESEISMHVHLEEVGAPPATELVLYQVAREAIENSVRHSGCSMITVNLTRAGREARLTVEDDGCGFDVGACRSLEDHFGLTLMRERVDAVGGTLLVDSRTGQGTVITVTVSVPGEGV
ncbi:MAG TPA: ATP-binding protein [Actinomycetota bacterium]|nr:ATP-binding protein [Actinomycetota bacterium]